MDRMKAIIEKIKHNIIVSVQSSRAEALYEEGCMLAMMDSVVKGGACALRLAGTRDIENAKKHFNVPIIGITKPDPLPPNWKDLVYITPCLEDTTRLIHAGADVIAFDGTSRPRPKEGLSEIISAIKDAGKVSMADISTIDEGVNCADLGVDIVSTTLSGYTTYTLDKNQDEPDFELLKELVKNLNCPIILEGRIWEPHQVRKAFELGAHSVVIGSAITRPQLITERFISYK